MDQLANIYLVYTQYYLINSFNQYFQLPTESLMDLYHQERLADCQQLMEDGNCTNPNQYYGILTARIYFSNDCLFVEVLCARDVVPLDNNGKIYTIYIYLYVCVKNIIKSNQ